jgi:hypothetical protein
MWHIQTINQTAKQMGTAAGLTAEQQNTFAGKAALNMFRFAAITDFVTPLAALILFTCIPAFAQTLPDGGVFADGAGGANFSNTSRSIFQFVKWLALVAGVVFVIWAIINGGSGKPFIRQAIGAVASFGASGIIHMLFKIGTGQDAGLISG